MRSIFGQEDSKHHNKYLMHPKSNIYASNKQLPGTIQYKIYLHFLIHLTLTVCSLYMCKRSGHSY